MNNIHLQTADGVILTTDLLTANKSCTISKMLKESRLLQNGRDAVVPMENVSSTVLRLVLEWAEHHKNDELGEDAEEEDAHPKKDLIKLLAKMDDWDKKFFKMEQVMLYKVINAANELQMNGLMEMGCACVAKQIKGFNAEDIRKNFGIKVDFSTSEIKDMKKEQNIIMDSIAKKR